VERAGTGRVWLQQNVTERQDGAIVLWLPARLLQPADYEFIVWQGRESAATLLATYHLRVAAAP
jgi:hypothetical protein